MTKNYEKSKDNKKVVLLEDTTTQHRQEYSIKEIDGVLADLAQKLIDKPLEIQAKIDKFTELKNQALSLGVDDAD